MQNLRVVVQVQALNDFRGQKIVCGHRCFGAPDRVWRPCFAESFTDPSTAAVTDPTNTEDVKAGNLGMPFTETED